MLDANGNWVPESYSSTTENTTQQTPPEQSQWAKTQQRSYAAEGAAANVAAQGAATAPSNPDNRNLFQKATDALGITDNSHNLPPAQDSNGNTANDQTSNKQKQAVASAIKSGTENSVSSINTARTENNAIIQQNNNTYNAIFGQQMNDMIKGKQPSFNLQPITSDKRAKTNIKLTKSPAMEFLDALTGIK